MARYIDADALLSRLPDYLSYKASVKRVLMQAHSADVAPKSEVARDIIYDIEMYVLGIKSGKEIIEKTTPKIYRLKRKDYMEAVLEYLAELKNKYTEEKE